MSDTFGRKVLRNNTIRDDAVYVVTGQVENGIYTVTGMWGRWQSFERDKKLQSKVYFTGNNLVLARLSASHLIRKKTDKHYFHVNQFCEPFPWERQLQPRDIEIDRIMEQQTARNLAPKPVTLERRPVVPPASKQTYTTHPDTVAGFLELYDE